MDLTKDSIDRIVALGATPAVNDDGDGAFVIAPQGFSVLDVSGHFPPTVTRQNVNLAEAASFISYVNRYKGDDTIILASVGDAGGSFTAIIDYHGKDTPGRAAHRAIYQVKTTKEWDLWLAHSGKKKTQKDFAIFLEETQDLIKFPAGAELLEFVLNLEGKQHVNFLSGQRLDNNKNSLQYTEEVSLRGTTQTQTKEGSLEMPKELTAAIAPFYGSEPVDIRARLKYSIEGRSLLIWYETISAHKIMRESLQLVVSQITKGTEIAPLSGSI